MAEKDNIVDNWDVEEWQSVRDWVSMTGSVCERRGNGDKNRKRRCSEAGCMGREVIFKTDGQVYAKVDAILGEYRCNAICSDNGKTRLCRLSGRLRHQGVRLTVGDIILLSLRYPWITSDFKADVILKYTQYEAMLLNNCGQLPPSFIKKKRLTGYDRAMLLDNCGQLPPSFIKKKPLTVYDKEEEPSTTWKEGSESSFKGRWSTVLIALSKFIAKLWWKRKFTC